MREIEFCEYWCGALTEEQKAVLEYKIKTGKFLGVGRVTGGMGRMPAFEGYPSKAWYVIDQCGYGQLSSSDGKILFENDWPLTAYYLERQQSGLGNRNGTTR
jgi:hypothetical protein